MIEIKNLYKSFEDKDVLMDINARFEDEAKYEGSKVAMFQHRKTSLPMRCRRF